MGSKAQSGLGLLLNVNTGTVSVPVWTAVGEVNDISQEGYQNETDDVTNFASTAREFIGTILNPGTWKISMNRVSNNAGQVKLQALLGTALLGMFQVILPINTAAGQTTTGDMYAFTAIVQEFPLTAKPDKAIKQSVTIKVSNGITYTEGS